MDLQFCPGAVVMVFVATLVAAFITSGGVRLGSVAFCCYSSTRSLTSRSIFGRRRGSDLLFAECLLISASLRAWCSPMLARPRSHPSAAPFRPAESRTAVPLSPRPQALLRFWFRRSLHHPSRFCALSSACARRAMPLCPLWTSAPLVALDTALRGLPSRHSAR